MRYLINFSKAKMRIGRPWVLMDERKNKIAFLKDCVFQVPCRTIEDVNSQSQARFYIAVEAGLSISDDYVATFTKLEGPEDV